MSTKQNSVCKQGPFWPGLSGNYCPLYAVESCRATLSQHEWSSAPVFSLDLLLTGESWSSSVGEQKGNESCSHWIGLCPEPYSAACAQKVPSVCWYTHTVCAQAPLCTYVLILALYYQLQELVQQALAVFPVKCCTRYVLIQSLCLQQEDEKPGVVFISFLPASNIVNLGSSPK